ncbi:MAG: GIY-YIG nuclease family protein [Candidatus Zixiibacteriota bacterium]
MPFYVYILQNLAGRFYTGQASDLDDRLKRHNSDRVSSTKGKGPWRIVYKEEFASRAEAIHREREIKRQKSRDLTVDCTSASTANRACPGLPPGQSGEPSPAVVGSWKYQRG